jgi:mono/diheme cytochrome c family protein
LGNPVAANLLESAKAGGPLADREPFVQVVSEGRLDRGMPAFKSTVSPEQMDAIYAYVKGRAHGRISPGRPSGPSS